MPEPRDDLRATEESIAGDAELIQELEAEKRRLDPSDPRVTELSSRIEDLAGRLDAKASAERELAEEIQRGG